MADATHTREAWGSRIGLILAMAGNAVGLGNFLRFPRQAAANDGGSFMIAYFIALLLLGIPLMWIEWGIGRHGGKYGKGHVPGFFASLWRHPAAKYLGVLGLAIPFIVLVYYTYIESWTLAFTFFSISRDYWGADTQESMVTYLRSFQAIGDPTVHGAWKAFLFFFVTLAINFWVISKGIEKGIEKLAKIGMPILFIFALVLAIVVLFLPPQPGVGTTAWDGLAFLFRPDLSGLSSPSVWLAAAGQIFFTLSVGMGTLGTYASYLSRKDDILLSGLATSATNETAEVVLGGTIAIPAAVVFFGVAGATQIAQGGSFDLGFATMPVVFQQLPLGNVLGFMWFGLLFFAGITSSVAMATPILAFLREEFGVRREKAAWALGGVVLVLGLLHVFFLAQGFLDEWDYWAGTFGLALFGMIEVILFMWVFKPENAWRSMHEGADIRLPSVWKFIMTYVTPVYLLVLFSWWAIQDAWPILTMRAGAGGGVPAPENVPYIIASRLVMVGILVVGLVLIRIAWKRNRYDDRVGFAEVDEPESQHSREVAEMGAPD
jgi:neurotransmitter:Na+ symporter, NSS family